MRGAQSEDSGGCVRVICLVIVRPLVSGQQQNEQQRQQHRQRHDGRDEQRLNLDAVGDEPDGRFFLGALRCVGACSLAPVVMVNDKVYGNMTADKVADILRECGE